VSGLAVGIESARPPVRCVQGLVCVDCVRRTISDAERTCRAPHQTRQDRGVGLHVNDREQKQFPVTLMTHVRIINHSVGCAV